jgi:serine/threonine protein kinase
MEKKLAFFFDEGEGYLFVKWIGTSSQGQVMLVRSVADGELYIRKVSFPTVIRDDNPIAEVLYCRPHAQIPTLVAWKEHAVHNMSLPTRLTSTIHSYSNGGDLGRFVRRNELTTALVWHMFERLLTVVCFLHYECVPGISQGDIAKRNIFLHWVDDDLLPQVLLGDFGHASSLAFKDRDSARAKLAWRHMNYDYRHLHKLISELVIALKSSGEDLPDNMSEDLRYLRQLRMEMAKTDNMNYKPSKLFFGHMLDSVQMHNKHCIAAYREQEAGKGSQVPEMSGRPEMGPDEEIMQLMHPQPLGPFQLVEINPVTYEVLAVRKQAEALMTWSQDDIRRYEHGRRDKAPKCPDGEIQLKSGCPPPGESSPD